MLRLYLPSRSVILSRPSRAPGSPANPILVCWGGSEVRACEGPVYFCTSPCGQRRISKRSEGVLTVSRSFACDRMAQVQEQQTTRSQAQDDNALGIAFGWPAARHIYTLGKSGPSAALRRQAPLPHPAHRNCAAASSDNPVSLSLPNLFEKELIFKPTSAASNSAASAGRRAILRPPCRARHPRTGLEPRPWEGRCRQSAGPSAGHNPAPTAS